jgi:DNA-binding protein HU-beta
MFGWLAFSAIDTTLKVSIFQIHVKKKNSKFPGTITCLMHCMVLSSLLVGWNEHFQQGENQMNRAELVENVAKATGQAKSEVTRTLSAFIHTVTGALAKGDKVTLVGFGTFERRMRKARTGRNPRTLAPLKIAAARVPAFRAGKELKDIVNGRAKQPTLVLAKPKAAAKPAKKAAAKPAKKAAAKPAKKAAKKGKKR